MKIIHIAGWSGSGKTTFVRELVTALSLYGTVGTVKHIGDHIVDLATGKDTTLHYEAGAIITAGIDLQKTMFTSRSISLPDALDLLSNAGVRYAIVEGFKKVGFQKVVFGDIDTPSLARNPGVDEVITLLPHFDEYYTVSGLMKEMKETESAGVLLSMTGPAITWYPEVVDRLEDTISRMNGVLDVRVRVNSGIFTKSPEYFIVIKARDHKTGISALQCPWPESTNTDVRKEE